MFGSYAAGKQKKESDIDFIVGFSEPDFDSFMDLITHLEKLFGKKVDIITREGFEGIRSASVAESIRRSVVYV